ncbi:MAG TPA: hypothetical protein VFT20_03125 [Candidatus Limnocylindrales bacterium]|nr:hypothetical protein [Candidatus Limnocylindrales bacterium]
MRVNRRFLYAGIFLVAIGAVLVAADLGAIDAGILIDALRLWPLAVVALGVGLVLRRTPLGLPGGMLAAAVPGLLLGSAFALGPRFADDCGERRDVAPTASEQGRFDGPADVSVTTGCGLLTLRTASGDGWELAAANTRNRPPTVSSTATSLEIEPVGREEWAFLDAGRDTWDLTLPTSPIKSLALVVNAGRGDVAVPGARLEHLNVTANAADVVVDASGAVVQRLTGAVNVGRLSLLLPADDDIDGSLRVSAGELQICAPPELGLRVTNRGTADHVTVEGLTQTGSVWQSAGYASAPHRADLRVSANFGAVEINPIGGCS